jgi:hypothetical protein
MAEIIFRKGALANNKLQEFIGISVAHDLSPVTDSERSARAVPARLLHFLTAHSSWNFAMRESRPCALADAGPTGKTLDEPLRGS